MSLLTDNQIASWQNGTCYRIWEMLGAHGVDGSVRFAVWAPNAASVYVVGDFNDWDDEAHPLEKNEETGIWSAVIPKAKAAQFYKYRIIPIHGEAVLKADPFGTHHEQGRHHASIIYELPDFSWSDEDWMNRRPEAHQPDKPLSVYEVHPGSWRRTSSGELMTYRQLGKKLIPYVKEMGFTHIELMPVMEHPYGPSWGYQVTGYFAPTSRYGNPEDFMAFIDACHRAGIGVILDWVPGHFPRDEHGLAYFDGTALFEHDDHRRREHADWGTYNFDFEKPRVRNFLLSNALYWCEKYHIDGLRVDAVASMLYLDYSKHDGEWLPNKYGGNENLGAIQFLQDFNSVLNEHHPSVLTFAEESTAWPGITNSVSDGGLGFDYKWNMGWMNDTLRYFSKPAEERMYDSHPITFPITYAFSERFILPFSHDEVVHLKKSLLNKMPGTREQQFAQLKMLFMFMIGSSGKKLIFMGDEIAEEREWSEGRELNWGLLDDDNHKEVQQFLSDLLHLYRSTPALYASDHHPDGFQWVDLSRKEQGVFAFTRMSEKARGKLIFIFNFSDELVRDYQPEGVASFEVMLDTGQGDSKSKMKAADSLILQPFQGLILQTAER